MPYGAVRCASVALPIEQQLTLLEQGARIVGLATFDWQVDGPVYWSDELFRLIGLDPVDRELDPEQLFACVHPQDRERLARSRAVARKRSIQPIEFRIVRPDGTIRFVRGTTFALEEPGKTPHHVGALVDVTDRCEAEMRAQMWLHALEESQRIGGLGTFVVVPSTLELRWSPGLYRLNGFTSEEPITAQRALERVHPDDRERQVEWFQQIVEQGTAPPLSVRTSGGAQSLVSYGAMVRLADGIDRVIGTTMDVTERSKLEEQLRNAAKMEAIGTLAAGVAHDFNNYLTLVGASIEAVKRSRASDDVHLDNARYGLERCAALTRQLLAFARRQPARPRFVDLRGVLETVARMLDPALGERIELRIDLPRDPVIVEADPAHLEQAIVNLATNAHEAMPDGGTLALRLSCMEGPASDEAAQSGLLRHACLEVEDSGGGIQPTHLEHVFEPYFTTKSCGGGTGLGLASAYGTVRQNLGTARVRSEIGRGTTFTILLPLSEGSIEESDPEPPAVVRRGRGRVLVVEDMPELRQVLAAALADAGYSAVEAADGQAALRIIDAEEPFDIIVSDMVMPNLGGVALAGEIERRTPGLPVVLMSGYADDPRIASSHTVLAKPFPIDDLLRAIEMHLARR